MSLSKNKQNATTVLFLHYADSHALLSMPVYAASGCKSSSLVENTRSGGLT